MAKKKPPVKTFSIQGFDVQAYKQTEAYVQAIDALYNKAILDFAQIATRTNIDPAKQFSFSDYPGANAAAQRIINTLASKMQSVISTGSRNQWLYACRKNDEFLSHIMSTSRVPKKVLEKMQDRNLKALDSFQNRKVNGMGLSKRVWNYAGQMKDTMEMGIDVGIGKGKSAVKLARDLKQYLKYPDKLFHKVKDKHGNLVLSKNAKAFHPGQGVYRSSVKNAQRLTRSEINMAYRQSDIMRWKQLDFVVGFEVKVSERHKEWLKEWKKHNPGKTEICDQLAGRYPKAFFFKGWHPQCMCHVIPIMMDRDEFNTDELNELKAAFKGEEYNKFTSRNTVTDVPDGLKNWVADNAEKSQGWKSAPYFIKENFQGGTIAGGLKVAPEASLNVLKPVITKPEESKSKIIMSESEFISKVKQAEDNGESVLYRGDIRDKGIDFSDEMTDYMFNGKTKNQGGFNFFTDKKGYAEEYATSAMNESIRAKSIEPNLTAISIKKDAKLFDFRNMTAKEAAQFELELNKIQKGYLDDYRRGIMEDVLAMDENKLIKKYPWISKDKKTASTRMVIDHPQTYSDFELGLSFKRYLKQNGYDGYVFKEYQMGAEFGIINKEAFKIIAKFFIKNK